MNRRLDFSAIADLVVNAARVVWTFWHYPLDYSGGLQLAASVRSVNVPTSSRQAGQSAIRPCLCPAAPEDVAMDTVEWKQDLREQWIGGGAALSTALPVVCPCSFVNVGTAGVEWRGRVKHRTAPVHDTHHRRDSSD